MNKKLLSALFPAAMIASFLAGKQASKNGFLVEKRVGPGIVEHNRQACAQSIFDSILPAPTSPAMNCIQQNMTLDNKEVVKWVCENAIVAPQNQECLTQIGRGLLSNQAEVIDLNLYRQSMTLDGQSGEYWIASAHGYELQEARDISLEEALTIYHVRSD